MLVGFAWCLCVAALVGDGAGYDLCGTARQSPIDLTVASNRGLEIRFLHRPWAFSDFAPDSGVLHFSGEALLQVGTSESFGEYVLTSVEVHSPGEHTWHHATWPLELQLWHSPKVSSDLTEARATVSTLAQRNALDEGLRTLRHVLDGNGSLDQSFDGPTLAALAARLQAESQSDFELADALSVNVQRLVQQTVEANHVVVSFLVRSSPTWSASPSRLLHWLTNALSSRSGGVLDIAEALGSERNFTAYRGSRTKPPCAPHVWWFVAEQPLVALAADVERLRMALEGGHPGLVGATEREVQPLGGGRDLQQVTSHWYPFREALPEDAPESIKWTLISRWAKVFLMSCGFLFASALFLRFVDVHDIRTTAEPASEPLTFHLEGS